jgi:hypothetical protein
LKDFSTDGITADQTFSKDDHVGSTEVMVVEAQGGKWVPVTDWISPKS